MWTQRWQSLEVVDLTDWVDTKVRRIHITQGLPNASYELDVRMFKPAPKDSLEKKWTHNGVVKTYELKPYAIVNMEKAFRSRLVYLDRYLVPYVYDALHKHEALITMTYQMALDHRQALLASDVSRNGL